MRNPIRLENAGRWLLNIDSPNRGFKSMFDQPLTWFGFSMEGQGANRAWAFGGRRIGGNPGSGRAWIPQYDKAGERVQGQGRWGSFAERQKEFNAIKGKGGVMARVGRSWLGRWGMPLLAGLGGYFSYKDQRRQGYGVLASSFRAAGTVALEAIKWRVGTAVLTNPIGFIGAAAVGAVAYHFWNKNRKERIGEAVKKTEFISNNFAMQTQAAYTMRQRSLRAISRSQISARMALGSEARFQHMNSNPNIMPTTY